MNFLRKLAVVLIALGSVSVARADPIMIEGLCDGTASARITCDTRTGSEWLDLSETVGLTIQQFLNGQGGYLDEGFRLATWD